MVDVVAYSVKSIVSVTVFLASVAAGIIAFSALAVALLQTPHIRRDTKRTAEHKLLVNSLETFTAADLRRGIELSSSDSNDPHVTNRV